MKSLIYLLVSIGCCCTYIYCEHLSALTMSAVPLRKGLLNVAPPLRTRLRCLSRAVPVPPSRSTFARTQTLARSAAAVRGAAPGARGACQRPVGCASGPAKAYSAPPPTAEEVKLGRLTLAAVGASYGAGRKRGGSPRLRAGGCRSSRPASPLAAPHARPLFRCRLARRLAALCVPAPRPAGAPRGAVL